MRGSLILNLDKQHSGFETTTVFIRKNEVDVGEIEYYQLKELQDLYITSLQNGDDIEVEYRLGDLSTGTTVNYNITKYDYTNDDEAGDSGIKSTLVLSGSTFSATGFTETFTVSLNPNAYSYKYVIDIDVENQCYTIGTGYRGTFGEPSQPAVRDIKLRGSLIYTVGNFTSYNGVPQSGMTVTNLDGSLYSGFTNSGFGIGVFPTALEILSDGKCYVNSNNYGGVSTNGLVRLNANGTRDTSFSGLTQNSGVFWDMEVQSDGKIICCGEFTSVNSTSRQNICRLNTNGSLDTSFGGTSGFTGTFSNAVVDIDIQSDGKILCAGYFTQYSGVSRNGVCRLNTDGTIDTTFTSPLPNDNNLTVLRIEQLSDGKILVGGSFRLVSGGTIYNIIKLNSDGTIDNSFNKISGNNFCPDFKEQSDGKIIVTLDGPIVDTGQIYRINSDGTTDTSFNELLINDTNLFTPESIELDESRGLFYAGGGFETVNGQSYYRFVSGFIDNGELNMCS